MKIHKVNREGEELAFGCFVLSISHASFGSLFTAILRCGYHYFNNN